MSTDPIKLATQAERDLNSHGAKQGQSNSDSAAESGVDESVSNKFPGANVTYGSEATGREVPLSDGGDINPSTGKLYKDTAFDGAGGKNEEHAPERNKLTVCVATGPETKSQIHREENAGNDEVRSNIRN